MQVLDLDYSDYLGQLAIGRVVNGVVEINDKLVCIGESGEPHNLKVTKIQFYSGLSTKDTTRA